MSNYQLAELTKGQSLPLPPIPPLVMRVIVDVVNSAWNELLSEYYDELSVAAEVSINAMLQGRLNNKIATDHAWGQLATCVIRGGEAVSFDASKLEKRPDISIYLTNRPPTFPLVVECKLIDPPSKPITAYGSNGISRFVSGEYAWGSSEGLMLAYVRDTSTVASCLKPFLASNQGKVPDPYATIQTPQAVPGMVGDIAMSSHARLFAYIHGGGGPGTIVLWHVWLQS